MNLVVDPTYAPGDPRSVVSFEPANPPGTKDFSLTNSKTNFTSVFLALCVGEFGLAARLASLAWDPPKASYIHPNASCTSNDQHLAYAIKHLFAGDRDAALAETAQIRTRKRDHPDQYQSAMVQALSTVDEDRFSRALVDLLEWHEIQRMKQGNFGDMHFFFSLPEG